jgi:hypothetical protein
LQTFKLNDGSIEVHDHNKEKTTFTLQGLDIQGVNISTDSIQWRHVIPFQMEDFSIAFDKLKYLPDPYSEIEMGPMQYSEHPTVLNMQNVSLDFTADVEQVSDLVGIQKDLISFSVDSLSMSGLAFDYDSLSIASIEVQTVRLKDLVLHDYRDKQKQRPEEPVKPLFEGMIKKIPIPMAIDTVLVQNADISYSERPENKEQFGTLNFKRAYATVRNLTNGLKSEKGWPSCNISIQAYINDHAYVKSELNIPYNDDDQFEFRATLDSVSMEFLNPTLHPLAGITIPSGMIHKMDFSMSAFREYSANQLTFEYDQLKINILSKHDKKSGLNWLANPLIRSSNLPTQKHYRTETYRAERNVYRGPFNMMWNGLKEGLILIIPSSTAQKLAGQGKKKSK